MFARLVCLSLALALTACAKKTRVDDSASATASEPAPSDAARQAAVTEAIGQLRDNFAKVHFDTDSSELDEASQAALARNAAILQEYPTIVVQVQGHADERGTTDYNLALGQRRAEKVKKYLVSQGVEGARLATVSYGEEMPAVAGAGEHVWAENRRVEFRITAGE